jgi:AraC family transcriptional regulator
MRTIKVLNNQNKIYNEITNHSSYRNISEEFSIRVVLTGNERYTTGKKDMTIYPGTFLVINDGTIFSSEIYSDVVANTFSVLYSADFLRAFHRDYTSYEKTLLDDPFKPDTDHTPMFLETIYPFSGDMMFNLLHLKNHYDEGEHNEILMDEYLYYGLLNFYRLYNKEILSKSQQLGVLDPGTKTELFKRLNNAKDYILSNYNEPITIDEISQHACLSKIHFYRTFKQTFKCTPHQYLIQSRLTNAYHMLKTTCYTITEIVNLIGFDNPSSFSRLFKERFGDTPVNYRAKIVA